MALTVLLRCDNLDATRHFYQALLGFTVARAGDTLTVEQYGGVLIFTEQDLWHGQPGFTGTFYFSVPDVDALFAALKDRVPLAWPLQVMPYGGREFGIRDCNGYHLAFRQLITG
ncbi:VOC family protein [Pseudomonas sp. GD03944]|uniref:VOC family protein n=1 Tax=Pseudomonas sp. GD03944 TaxID=2975409 RepID=UPI002449C5E7|nr:VOC family protein [Pseudomonas sp. GD03944]MDH1265781.1 bleomycin resistance family protein [Pseudomonas sp. GD03944]